jgi:hypothetical protein
MGSRVGEFVSRDGDSHGRGRDPTTIRRVGGEVDAGVEEGEWVIGKRTSHQLLKTESVI